jgi:hypothetical protein
MIPMKALTQARTPLSITDNYLFKYSITIIPFETRNAQYPGGEIRQYKV